ncbi:MAG: hypothetical protein OJF62_000940 [Pseudolabrys sp.]|nr:hypothetical protein [Pseudolabrys sp.]
MIRPLKISFRPINLQDLIAFLLINIDCVLTHVQDFGFVISARALNNVEAPVGIGKRLSESYFRPAQIIGYDERR